MDDKMETRTKRDESLGYFLGVCFGIFVAAIVFLVIYEYFYILEKPYEGATHHQRAFPPIGSVAVIGLGLIASSLGFRILNLAKFLYKSFGSLIMGSGELLGKTALEATVKLKEGKRKVSEIAREADNRVGVKQEIKTEEDAYERAAEELENGKQSKGIWAKAFSDANGEEQRQKALYIKYRAEQLIKNIVEQIYIP